MQKEIWKDIKGYEGYYKVSNLGNVKSLTRVVKRVDGKRNYIKERILKNKRMGAGYRSVVLCINGLNKYLSVHRLVALHFISNPENKPDVNHENGIKTDNSVKNLSWVTKKENSKHAFETGLNTPPNYKRKVMSNV